MHMITDEMPRFHPRYSQRILYVGRDHSLSKFLSDELEDCQVVRCPDGSQARVFIEHIKYSLLLFDEELPDTTGRALMRFARSLTRRKRTPTIILNKLTSLEGLASVIPHLLPAPQQSSYTWFYRKINCCHGLCAGL